MIWLLLIAALFVGCAAPRSSVDDAALEWRDCGAPFECAELRVPLDPDAAARGELSLALLRRPAEKPAERIGTLVVNPGGPGISAVDHLRSSAARYGAAVRERFDLVAFDTRGTGASSGLDCHESLAAFYAQDPTPETDAEWAAVVTASRAFADECARRHADVLPFMGTRESARDLDLVRRALGEEQISYLGFSYGTALGAVYASLYPERVRAMVLDGAVEPSFELLRFAREQAIGVEGALGAYEAAALKEGWHGTDVLDAVTARAEAGPIPSRGELRPAHASDVLYGTVEGLIAPGDGWHELASALGSAQAGDGAGFVRLSDHYFQREPDGSSGLRVEAQLAVLCADLHRLASIDAYREALAELERSAPHIGVPNLISLLPCAFWPTPARPLPPLEPGAGAHVLVIAGSADPLTPHVWGERLAQEIGAAAQLDVETDVHTAYGRGDDCTGQIVERFLLALELPPAPSRCPSAKRVLSMP